jgi:O-antigen ligase
MLCGYALLLIINYEEYRPRFSAVSLALTAFLASFTLSTFFGMDAYHSFWDNHERMLGLFTVVHYVIYYFICTAVLKNWSDWKRALQVFLIAGSIVMFIGVLQKFNQNLLLNQGSDRVASTLGNAIYVGGYGLFLFFVSMLLASREKRFWLKLLYGGFSVLALFGLFFSGTRGSVLGILAGLSTVLIAYSFLLKSNPPLRRVAFYLIAFIVLLSGSLFIFRHNPIIANLPAVGRLLSTSLTNGSSDTRKIAWKIGIEGWQERPIFGWGPNNFFYAFNQFYNPRSLEFGYGETWFDNAHNIIINTLTVQGIFGLLTYLAIFVLAILTLWQSKDREQRLHLIAWGTGFLVAHLVQNITVFENPTSYLYFVFWLALVNRLGSPLFLAVTTAPGVSPAKDRSVGPLAIGSILLVGAALIFVFNIQPARANKKTLTALQALSLDPVKGLAVAKEAIAFNSPHVDDIRGDIARTITDILSNSYQKIGKTEGTELLQTAYAALNANTKLHPADIRTYLLLSQLGQLGFAITQNSQFISDAERYMTIGLSYSPRRQQFLYTLANFKLQLGKKDEAYALMQQALDDDPKILETYWRFAYIYQLSDQNEKARQILALAHERGIPFTDQARQVEQLIVSSTPTKNGK